MPQRQCANQQADHDRPSSETFRFPFFSIHNHRSSLLRANLRVRQAVDRETIRIPFPLTIHLLTAFRGGVINGHKLRHGDRKIEIFFCCCVPSVLWSDNGTNFMVSEKELL